MRLTPEQAEQKLKDDGFIKLPPGSYFKWIEKDRFEMYKPLLSFKNGMWMPRLDKLHQINELDVGYKIVDWKKYGAEQYNREEINSLIES